MSTPGGYAQFNGKGVRWNKTNIVFRGNGRGGGGIGLIQLADGGGGGARWRALRVIMILDLCLWE